MIRDVILYPDRRLETPCDAVKEFDTSALNQLVADLLGDYAHAKDLPAWTVRLLDCRPQFLLFSLSSNDFAAVRAFP
jgi:hypothetical protein